MGIFFGPGSPAADRKRLERLRQMEVRARKNRQLLAESSSGEIIGNQQGPFAPGLLQEDDEGNLINRTKPFAEQDPNIQAGMIGRALQVPGLVPEAQGLLAEATPAGAGELAAARQARITSQRESLEFAQDSAAKQQEAQLKALQIGSASVSLARSGFEFEQLKAASVMPKVTPEQALQFNSLKGALDSIDTMIQIRKDFGTMSPAELAGHPEAAAALKSFQSFETVSLFKSLLNDQRVSDEDRDFYRSIIDRGFFDVVFAGGAIEEAQLQQLADRLARTQQVMLATTPDALELLPTLFQRKRDTFTDIGVPFERVPPPQNAPPSLGSFGSVGGSF